MRFIKIIIFHFFSYNILTINLSCQFSFTCLKFKKKRLWRSVSNKDDKNEKNNFLILIYQD